MGVRKARQHPDVDWVWLADIFLQGTYYESFNRKRNILKEVVEDILRAPFAKRSTNDVMLLLDKLSAGTGAVFVEELFYQGGISAC